MSPEQPPTPESPESPPSPESPERASRRPPGRRDQLLTAALDVVGRVGPGASMDEMAAEAGITKPVLYRYFGDRDGLIGAMAERFSSTLVARLESALAGADETPPEELIHRGIETYVAFIEEDPALYQFLTQHATLGGPVLVAIFDRVAGSIGRVVESVLETWGLDTRPVAAWATGIVGMVHLAGARWARQTDGPREQLVDDLTTLVAHGIVGASVASLRDRVAAPEP